MVPNCTLNTQRLLLRQFDGHDLDNIFIGLSNPEVIRYYGVSYNTRDETKKQLKFFSDLQRNETGIWWAICSTDNETFYGGCGLNNLAKQHQKAEIGYWLLPPYWGKGIIREALPAVVHYAFTHLGLHRIEALVETGNLPSKKVLANLLFNYEGKMTDCEVKEGRYISLEIYARLNPN